MLRRLSTLLLGPSLLLSVAALAFWVRSYRRADCLDYAYGSRAGGRYGQVYVTSDVGQLKVTCTTEEVPPARAAEYERAYVYRFRRPGAVWEAWDPWAHPRPPEPRRNLTAAGVWVDPDTGPVGRPVPFPVRRTGRVFAWAPHWAVAATASGRSCGGRRVSAPLAGTTSVPRPAGARSAGGFKRTSRAVIRSRTTRRVSCRPLVRPPSR